jgi:hypothetical protein
MIQNEVPKDKDLLPFMRGFLASIEEQMSFESPYIKEILENAITRIEELEKKAREAGIKAIQKLYSDSKNISIEQQAISNISNKEKCECRNCLDDFEKLNPPGPGLSHWTTRMVVCSICGNKRCPHANNHNNPCTNSNEPGQPGSSYSMSEIKNKTTQPSDAPEPARARRLVGWHPPAAPVVDVNALLTRFYSELDVCDLESKAMTRALAAQGVRTKDGAP